MMLSELTETGAHVLVIYPGRFQPFHKGHKAVYDYLNGKYDNVYIATSDKVDPPRSPFSFEEKKKMMELTGMDTSNVVLTKSPYQAMEITQNFDPKSTILFFAISEKDMAEDPRFGFKPKKDGSPSYFQDAKEGNLETMDKHGYIMTVPTFEFDVLGKPMKSATEVRSSFSSMDDSTKKQLIQDLFGNYSDEVFSLMSTKITESDEDDEDFWDASNPENRWLPGHHPGLQGDDEETTESTQHGNHPHRVLGGLDGDIKNATAVLEDLFMKVRESTAGTQVRRQLMLKFHTTLNALKQQMAINLKLRESRRNKIKEKKHMSSQKLAVFSKGNTKVSLWEHDGTVILVDQRTNRLQETKGTVRGAIDLLHRKGYVCESMAFTPVVNKAGKMLKVAYDKMTGDVSLRSGETEIDSGGRTYEELLAQLQKQGYSQAKDSAPAPKRDVWSQNRDAGAGDDMGGELQMEPMDGQQSADGQRGTGHYMAASKQVDPEDAANELMAARNRPMAQKRIRSHRLKY